MEEFTMINFGQFDLEGTIGFGQLFYIGNLLNDYNSLNISVAPYSRVGTFTTESGVASIRFIEQRPGSGSNDWISVKGTIQITNIKNGVIEGLFSATLAHLKNQKANLEITDGKFKATIRELE